MSPKMHSEKFLRFQEETGLQTHVGLRSTSTFAESLPCVTVFFLFCFLNEKVKWWWFESSSRSLMMPVLR
jgi:hypothetical protein